MSRGLGKLQRLIKALIEAQDERYRRECEADPEHCDPFWLTWSDIRFVLFVDVVQFDYANPIHRKLWPSFERAAKRALHTLWKRGEIGRIWDERNGRRFWVYMARRTYDESFSPEVGKELKAALERLEDQAA
jgi:hypothetical protein